MKLGSRRIAVGAAGTCAAGTAAVWAMTVALVSGQAAPAPKPAAQSQNQLLAENVFKNVKVLRGIPVDEFMGTMGVFSAALGISCEDCHTGGSNNWELYAEDVNPRKNMARIMVNTMQGINKQYFGGRQVVTCFSCHRGALRPRVTPSLVQLYAPVTLEELDVMLPPAPPDTPTPAQIIDKYLQAVGAGAAKLTSIAAKGTYAGYGPDSFPRPFEMSARAPNQKVTVLRDKEAGDSITVFSGKEAWISAPFRPVDVLDLHGAELDSARVEAELTFPVNVKAALTEMRSSVDFINDRSVLAVQGNKGNALVTMYFDEETGLMTRLVRSTGSPVGRLPIQTDFSDFRVVNGVQLPFKWTVTWLDGRANYEASEIQTNVAVDAGRLTTRPAPPKPY